MFVVKTIYGLVQSAIQYFEIFYKILVEKIGFQNYPSDSCLFAKKDPKRGIWFISMYFDDNITIWDQEDAWMSFPWNNKTWCGVWLII